MWYYVVEVDGIYKTLIDTKGKPNKYGAPKKFKTKKDAQSWIDRQTIYSASWHYEIKKASDEFIDRFGWRA